MHAYGLPTFRPESVENSKLRDFSVIEKRCEYSANSWASTQACASTIHRDRVVRPSDTSPVCSKPASGHSRATSSGAELAGRWFVGAAQDGVDKQAVRR